MRISATEFVRCDEALAEPVIITRNGRDRLIVMSVAMYRELTNPTDPAKPGGRKQLGSRRSRHRKS